MVQEFTEYSNQFIEFKKSKATLDPALYPHTRQRAPPITKSEIYAYMGALLLMGCYSEANRATYWNANAEQGPTYPNLRKSISLRRFEFIESNFYCSKPLPPFTPSSRDSRTPFDKVMALSDSLQSAFKKYYSCGSHVAVDETIQGFTSRVKEIVNIPVKPTPEGFKIWVLANAGYVISWLFYAKGATGPVGLNSYYTKELRFNNTQAVVLQLLRTLPDQVRDQYVVYLDNLFTSRRLLSQLRNNGIGAAGTVRTQNIKEELIKASISKADADRIEADYLKAVDKGLVSISLA
jgi:hypothetical protein